MLLASLSVIVGLAFLVWSADRFIDGAGSLAHHLGIPQLIIGMVIVGFGTSAPEMFVSLMASLQGNSGIALGNAIGSNITNIGLILGIIGFLTPLHFSSTMMRRDIPMVLFSSCLTGLLIFNQYLSLLDGIILLSVLLVFLGFSIYEEIRHTKLDEISLMGEKAEYSLPVSVLWTLLGLVLLISSSRLLVWALVIIARDLGVSDVIIGLTVVAIGTSLPELASSYQAAKKGSHEIAIGNVLGSNLFNILGVVGIACVAKPFAVERVVFYRDWGSMFFFTLCMFVVPQLRKDRAIDRKNSWIFMSLYGVYSAVIAWYAVR